MRKLFGFLLCLMIAAPAFTQDAKRLDVTNFEDGLEWSYSGSSVTLSFVELQPFQDPTIKPKEGEASLLVEYNNNGSAWSWTQLNFPSGAIDATGMTELHMWVYYLPTSVPNADGNFEINITFGEVNLGYQRTQITGEWVELVWPIDTLTSTTRLSSVSFFGGFISPNPGDLSGSLYIDDIYFYRPAGIQETETVLVYGFNEEDPDTGYVQGWGTNDAAAQEPVLGKGEVTPSEGTNYMEFALGSGWTNVIHSTSALADFDRWADVQEIMLDARVESTGSEWGPQTCLVIQTGTGGWDQYAENTYQNVVDDWATLVWKVNMSKHAETFTTEGGWLNLFLSTNNGASGAGKLVFFDNFRAVVTKQTPVLEWPLY